MAFISYCYREGQFCLEEGEIEYSDINGQRGLMKKKGLNGYRLKRVG